MKMYNIRSQPGKMHSGFSIIELLLAMTIGLALMAGVFSVFLNSQDSQEVIFAQVELIDESRVAVEILSYDLKRAGLWGKNNSAQSLVQNTPSFNGVIGQFAGSTDCVNALGNNGYGGLDPGWSMDVTRPVFGFSEEYIGTNGMPYSNCISGTYLRGDTVEMRYIGEKIAADALNNTTVYVVSQGQYSDVFFGAAPTQPLLAIDANLGVTANDPPVTYHKYEAVLYYVSSWTDVVGDGVPSLRRVSLQSGPTINDDVLLSGVETLQIQFGIDTDGNDATETVQSYSDPSLLSNSEWSSVRSAQIWIVVQSKVARDETVAQQFYIPGVPGGTYPAALPSDDLKRFMASSTSKLRNIAYQ